MVIGKNGIYAKVVCDSVSESKKRITTLELSYPRIIHSEFMTHRQFSRNAASSRAIPFKAMVENLNGIPVRFGAANTGMQDKGGEWECGVYLTHDSYAKTPQIAWGSAKEAAIEVARGFYNAGYHKQVYNRLLEPFQMMKVVVTATEWANFFWLRDDEAADPTIQALARCMKQAMNESEPQVLKSGQWHLPFVDTFCDASTNEFCGYCIGKYPYEMLSIEEAIRVSAARCAAVSYRKEDYGLEKCLQVFDRLVGNEKKHSSALEHQATPMKEPKQSDVWLWEEGATHLDREGNLWSGNYCGWIQHRQLLPNNVKKG